MRGPNLLKSIKKIGESLADELKKLNLNRLI